MKVAMEPFSSFEVLQSNKVPSFYTSPCFTDVSDVGPAACRCKILIERRDQSYSHLRIYVKNMN